MTGTFTVGRQAPFCQCKKEQLMRLGGEIPEGLNRRTLESFKPPTDQSFECHGVCSCKKVHRFSVTVNVYNFVIENKEPV